jgi:MFS family permease
VETVKSEPLTPFQTILRRSAGVLGVFLTLSLLGFGLVLFGRQNLEIVSDTVSHSFGRAFVTGLLGQVLLLPTFGMLVVGLILSVAGILLLPFAVAVFAMLVVIGVVGGYLAVAHAMGETYTRRRMALGAMIGSPNSYRYLLVGLGALASLWAAWALFGWVPVAGSIVWGAAFFVSWLLGTTGFGAALLSRAGIKENFAGRLLPPEALTDEYLWATPQFGVPAGRRPGTRTPSRGL